jgi:hypothetical protein
MGYKVLAPCTVRSADSLSAVHYREVGVVIDVPHAEDVEPLVAGGFIEKVADESKAGEEPKPAEPEGDSPLAATQRAAGRARTQAT